MAADSEATESGHTRYDVEKIWTCGGLLLGFSGSDATRRLIMAAIEGVVKQHWDGQDEIDRQEGRTGLVQAVGPTLKRLYAEFVPASPEETPRLVGGTLLAIGRDGDGLWLLEVNENATATFYEDRGFQAIGSGGQAAYISREILAHYKPAGRPLEDLRLIAFRIAQTCIDALGGNFGVGGRVNLWSCAGDGGFEQATANDLAATAEGLEQWRTIERESLDDVFPTGEDAPEADPGVPEALEDDDEGNGAQG